MAQKPIPDFIPDPPSNSSVPDFIPDPPDSAPSKPAVPDFIPDTQATASATPDFIPDQQTAVPDFIPDTPVPQGAPHYPTMVQGPVPTMVQGPIGNQVKSQQPLIQPQDSPGTSGVSIGIQQSPPTSDQLQGLQGLSLSVPSTVAQAPGDALRDAYTMSVNPITEAVGAIIAPRLPFLKSRQNIIDGIRVMGVKAHQLVDKLTNWVAPLGSSSPNQYEMVHGAADIVTDLVAPTGAMEGAVKTFFPVSILDAATVIYSTGRIIGTKAVEMAIPRVADMLEVASRESATAFKKAFSMLGDDVAEIERASKGLNPIVKRIQGATSEETIGNILERKARKKLGFEYKYMGVDAGTPFLMKQADEAIKAIQGGLTLNLKQVQQLTDGVVEAIKTNDITWDVGMRYLNRPDLAKESAAAQRYTAEAFRQLSSQAGYNLYQIKRIGDAMRVSMSGNAEAMRVLNSPELKWSWFSYKGINTMFQFGTALQNAMLTNMFGLSMRNTLSHAGLYSTNLIDDAMSSMWGQMTGRINSEQAAEMNKNNVFSAIHMMQPTQRKSFLDLLDFYGKKYPMVGSKVESIFGSPVADVAIGQKWMKFLNPIDYYNYRYFYMANMDAYMRNTAVIKGVGVKELEHTDLIDALNHAKQMTLA